MKRKVVYYMSGDDKDSLESCTINQNSKMQLKEEGTSTGRSERFNKGRFKSMIIIAAAFVTSMGIFYSSKSWNVLTYQIFNDYNSYPN